MKSLLSLMTLFMMTILPLSISSKASAAETRGRVGEVQYFRDGSYFFTIENVFNMCGTGRQFAKITPGKNGFSTETALTMMTMVQAAKTAGKEVRVQTTPSTTDQTSCDVTLLVFP